jgi:CheY-like chemotaxis protein
MIQKLITPEKQIPLSEQPKITKYKRVLIIDDDELDTFINKKLIKSLDFSDKVYSCSSAKNAIEFLKNIDLMDNLSREMYPEIVFVDLNMPIMDGFQFVEFFLKKYDTKILKSKLVILTSSLNEHDRKRISDISKNIVFLTKPLTQEILDKL